MHVNQLLTAFLGTAFGVAGALALACSPAGSAPDKTLGVATMSAVVNSTGSLLRTGGAVSAERLETGQYRVIFSRDVYPVCTYVANLSGVGATGSHGFVQVDETVTNVKSVIVNTRNTTNSAEDRGFHLIVFCPR